MKSRRSKSHFSGTKTGKTVRIGVFICVLLLTNVLRLPFLLSNRADIAAVTNQTQDAKTSRDADTAPALTLSTRDEDASADKKTATRKSTLSQASGLSLPTEFTTDDALLNQLVKSLESSVAEEELEQADEAETDGTKKSGDSHTASANPCEDRESDDFDDENYDDYPKNPFLVDPSRFSYHPTTFDGIGFLSGNGVSVGALGSSGGTGGGGGGGGVISP